MENSELQQLRQKVIHLETRVASLEQKLGFSPQAQQRTAQLTTTPLTPMPEPKASPVEKPAISHQPAPPRESWEQRIGGTWLNRLGVVALLVGLAFFLKYAFDNNWINELGRVIIGYCAGVLLLAGGFWFQGKGKMPKFGSGLGGAGIGAWFITTWTAYNFYQILSQTPAYAVMAAVTIAGVALALYWNSPAIAGLGLLVGYLTPILIQGVGGHYAQFIYLLILNIGALAILVKKNWNGLAFISLGFTVVISSIALVTLYEEAYLVPFMLFITAYHLIFALQGMAANLVHRSRVRPPILGTSIVSGGFYALFSAILLYGNHRTVLAAVIFAWGLFYLIQMAVVQRYRGEDKSLVFVLLGLGLGYITLSVPILLSQAWVTMAWTIQAALLIVIGWRIGLGRVRTWGLLVLGLVLGRLFFIDLQFFLPVSRLVSADYIAPWSSRLPAALLALSVMLLTIWLYKGDKVSKLERGLVPWLIVGANILALMFILGEWSRWFYYLGRDSSSYSGSSYRATAWTLTMAGNIGLLMALWKRWKYKTLKVLTLILIPIAMLWSGFLDIRLLSGSVFTSTNYISPWAGRLPAALLVAVLTFLAVWLFSGAGKGKKYLSWLAALANLLILGAVLQEFSRYYSVFRDTLNHPWQVYRNTAWSAVMSAYGFMLVALGVWRKSTLLRRLGITLLLVTVAKIMLVDLTGLETVWRILVFLGTGLILILASWLYQKFVIINVKNT